MSLTQGGQSLGYPSVLPAFQNDVNYMRDFAMSMGGQTLPQGSFSPSQGMTNAATLGNNYFGGGGVGNLGMEQFANILSGNNLNPSTNPYLQGTIGSLTSGFQQGLGSAQDRLNAQFGASGQAPNSGANANASTMLARGGLSDFNNALSSTLFGNYQQGQNQITQTLGMMDQPLTTANFASGLGQAPGQLAYQGQLAQNQLSQMPFDLLAQMMQVAPVGNESFAPSEPSGLGSWLNLFASALNSGANIYSHRNA
jgi:hypothetical protein